MLPCPTDGIPTTASTDESGDGDKFCPVTAPAYTSPVSVNASANVTANGSVRTQHPATLGPVGSRGESQLRERIAGRSLRGTGSTSTLPTGLNLNSRPVRVASFYAALTAAAILWGALRGHANVLLWDGESATAGSASHSAAHFVSSGAIGVAMGLLLVLLSRILHGRYAWARVLYNEFNDVLGPLSDGEILLLAAASAIGEECLFRGALLLHLQALLPGAPGLLLAIVGSAAVFALLHIGPGSRFLPWTASAFVVGLILAIVFVLLGDLVAPIAIHFTVNLLNLKDIVRRTLPA